MAYEIIWSEISLQDYNGIVEYLIDEWSLSAASNFVDIVNKKLDNLSKQPLVGIMSEKNPSIRSILFTPHNRLYYKLSGNIIELLAIIDTRTNPTENPFNIAI